MVLGAAPLIAALGIVPLYVLLLSAGGALLGAALLAVLILIQMPIFYLCRRWLPDPLTDAPLRARANDDNDREDDRAHNRSVSVS